MKLINPLLNGYEEFIDVDSLIDFLIITEFTNNTEAVFYRSCYMYKPSDEKRLGTQKRNFDRWDILNKKIGAGNVDHRTYNTFDLQVEYLREFINTRYNWIDENISEFRLQ